MQSQRGSVIPAVAFMFGAAVLVTILAWQFWPKDKEIFSNSSLDSNQVVNFDTNSNTNTTNSNSNTNSNTNSTVNTNPPVVEQPNNQKLGTYETEIFVNTKDKLADTRLVLVEGSKRTTIVSSTGDAAGLSGGFALMEFIFPASGSRLYLNEVLMDSDSGRHSVWSYNVVTREMLKLSQVASAGFMRPVVSPDKMKAAYIGAVMADQGFQQELHVFDAATGASEIVVQLRGNETLNAGAGGLVVETNVSWDGNSKVKYSVYDQSTYNQNSDDLKTKIADRTVEIN